jgi:hypothetical protein
MGRIIPKVFLKIKYVAPNGKIVEGFFEKSIKGYHPAELRSDEQTTIEIPKDKIIWEELV